MSTVTLDKEDLSLILFWHLNCEDMSLTESKDKKYCTKCDMEYPCIRVFNKLFKDRIHLKEINNIMEVNVE